MWRCLRLVCLVGLVGCGDRPGNRYSPCNVKVLQVEDAVPLFNAYLTWTNYKPNDSTLDAHLVWSGEDLGAGHAAAEKLLNRLRQLPDESRVLIYPSYHLKWRVNRGGGTYPWFAVHDEILSIGAQKHLTLIYSPRDHLGNLHPDCIPPGMDSGGNDGAVSSQSSPAAAGSSFAPASARADGE